MDNSLHSTLVLEKRETKEVSSVISKALSGLGKVSLESKQSKWCPGAEKREIRVPEG